MKLIIILYLMFMLFNAQAASKVIFVPFQKQAMVLVQTVNPNTGSIDKDPFILYDLMNSEEKTLPGGDKGKLYESKDKSVAIACVERVQSGLRQCQIHFKPSNFLKMDPVSKKISYARLDDEVLNWLNLFEPDENGEFNFITTDEKFIIRIHKKFGLQFNYFEN